MIYPVVRELAEDGIPVSVTMRVLKLARQPYYRLWNRLVGKVGRQAAHRLLRARVRGASAATYPHLAAECDRQVERTLAEYALFARGRW